MDAIKELTAGMLKSDVPEILIGSTVKVHVRIKEGEKERIQVFEGTVIAKNNSGIAETFTVRRVAYGVGVERVAMLKYGIDDIRLMYENDMRFIEQFK